MSDFLCFALATAMAYFFSLAGIEYAQDKPKDIKILLICLITVVLSVFNAWAITVNQNKIPIASVEKKWNEYINYCKEENISWDEYPFPHWLTVEASID